MLDSVFLTTRGKTELGFGEKRSGGTDNTPQWKRYLALINRVWSPEPEGLKKRTISKKFSFGLHMYEMTHVCAHTHA